VAVLGGQEQISKIHKMHNKIHKLEAYIISLPQDVCWCLMRTPLPGARQPKKIVSKGRGGSEDRQRMEDKCGVDIPISIWISVGGIGIQPYSLQTCWTYGCGNLMVTRVQVAWMKVQIAAMMIKKSPSIGNHLLQRPAVPA